MRRRRISQILRGVYAEPCEILRYAQNDGKSEVLLQNDSEGLRMTDRHLLNGPCIEQFLTAL